MKQKTKEIVVNLPAVHLFESEDEIPIVAAAFNTFVHGKVKLKYEVLGLLGGQTVGLFYLQRNDESQRLHDSFMEMINAEEMSSTTVIQSLASEEKSESDRLWDPFDS